MKDRIVAEIDINQLKTNIDSIKKLTDDRPLYVTVKANAYGHGIIEISKYLTKFGVNTLCVASFDEAMSIRKNNIQTNILILAPIPCDEDIICTCIENNIYISVDTKELADKINYFANRINKKALIHIKVDTGMSRVGINSEYALNFIKYVKSLSSIRLFGIFTHLSAADDLSEREWTLNQINIMQTLKQEVNDKSIIFHTANSAGIQKYPEAYMDAVRGGIIVYGYEVFPDLKDKLPIKPILKLKSHIIHIKTLPKGTSIGYNRTYFTDKETKVATVSCGYGDGYSRALSNKGFVYINNQKVPIIGRICMDIFMCDVTGIDCNLNDEVFLYDCNYKETNIENIANSLNTISYEILTHISERVKRNYIE